MRKDESAALWNHTIQNYGIAMILDLHDVKGYAPGWVEGEWDYIKNGVTKTSITPFPVKTLL